MIILYSAHGFAIDLVDCHLILLHKQRHEYSYNCHISLLPSAVAHFGFAFSIPQIEDDEIYFK